MKKFVLLTISLVAMVACNSTLSPENELRVETIDSLNTVLNNVETDLRQWQDSSLIDDAKEAEALYTYLENTYPDKENRTFWITQMNALRRVYKAYGKFGKAQDFIKRKLPLSREQLKALENSIREEALEEKQIEEYMVIETREVNKIYDLYYRFSPEAEVSAIIWDTLKVSMYQIKTDLDTLK